MSGGACFSGLAASRTGASGSALAAFPSLSSPLPGRRRAPESRVMIGRPVALAPASRADSSRFAIELQPRAAPAAAGGVRHAVAGHNIEEVSGARQAANRGIASAGMRAKKNGLRRPRLRPDPLPAELGRLGTGSFSFPAGHPPIKCEFHRADMNILPARVAFRKTAAGADAGSSTVRTGFSGEMQGKSCAIPSYGRSRRDNSSSQSSPIPTLNLPIICRSNLPTTLARKSEPVNIRLPV